MERAANLMDSIDDLRAAATELAARLQAYQDHQVVPLPSAWYEAGTSVPAPATVLLFPTAWYAAGDTVCNHETTTPPPAPQPAPPPPPVGLEIPGFDPVTAVQILAGQDAAQIVDAHPPYTQFRVHPGAVMVDVRPRTGQHLRGDGITVTVNDGTGRGYGIRARNKGESDDVVIGGMAFKHYGAGTKRAAFGAVQGYAADTIGGEYIYEYSDGWFLYDLELERNAANGITLGDHFTVFRCTAFGHTVTGFGGGRIVGGLVHSCELAANGLDPATGAGANGANMKVTWVNANEGRTAVTSADPVAAPFLVTDTVFNATRAGVTGSTRIGMWFDLDCQQVNVENCDFHGHAATSIFYEGCNGGLAARNRVHGSDGYGTGTGWNYANAAICAGESTNIVFEDNYLEGCDIAMMNRMSNRSSDWYNADNGSYVNYSWPAGPRYWIRADGPAPIPAVGATSNHWTGANTFRRNTLVGCGRVMINEGTNAGGHTVVGSTDLDSIRFVGNDYTGSPGVQFFERSNTSLSLPQWQSLPRQRDQ